VRFCAGTGFFDATAGMATMVVSLAIEYLGQAYYPPPLDVHMAALAVGRTSSSLAQLVTQEGRAIAFARTTFVSVCEGRAMEVPPALALAVRAQMLKA
jgi:acyl-CoA thioester hydrolase